MRLPCVFCRMADAELDVQKFKFHLFLALNCPMILPPKEKPSYLFSRHRIPNQSQGHQLLKPRQRVQIRQLGQPVLRKNQRRQVRYARRDIWLDIRDAVLCEEQRSQARLQGEVAELRNVVIGQIDGVVVLEKHASAYMLLYRGELR
jgi:hypothetical protein